ncbi:MAG: DUF502 domain-containing protein [Maricaulaceae bacterium]|jgi:uncharacterized membrane protein
MARKSRKGSDTGEPPILTEQPKFSLWLWLRNSFFTGIVVAAPITVTVWLVYTFINFADRTVKPLIPRAYLPEEWLGFAIPGFGLIVAILVLTMLGALAANILGRSLLQVGERLVARVPFVRTIYGALKQLLESVFSQTEKSFKEVVMIQYPREGLWVVGFITTRARGEVKRRLGEDYLGVFVPSTPNPTSGFIVWLPESDVVRLNMSVEDGANLIVSAGIVIPEEVQADAAFAGGDEVQTEDA